MAKERRNSGSLEASSPHSTQPAEIRRATTKTLSLTASLPRPLEVEPALSAADESDTNALHVRLGDTRFIPPMPSFEDPKRG